MVKAFKLKKRHELGQKKTQKEKTCEKSPISLSVDRDINLQN